MKLNKILDFFGVLIASGLLVTAIFGSLWLAIKSIKLFFGIF